MSLWYNVYQSFQAYCNAQTGLYSFPTSFTMMLRNKLQPRDPITSYPMQDNIMTDKGSMDDIISTLKNDEVKVAIDHFGRSFNA